MAGFTFRLPAFLAGSDNKVKTNQTGAKKVVGVIGGVALGAGAIGVGLAIFDAIRNATGADDAIGTPSAVLGAE